MKHILIVDDSEVLRLELKACLSDAGFGVLEAADGFEAFKLLSTDQTVDLILCDFNMPQMDGLTLISKTRELEIRKDTPILMLTTETSDELTSRARILGVLAWIVKPHDPELLVEGLKDILE